MLALAVLLELDVHPRQPHDRPFEWRATSEAPLVEAGADPLDIGDEIATDLVHDVVAEPLEEAHDGLRLAEQAALLRGHQALHPVFRAIGLRLATDRSAQAPERLPAEPARLAAEEPELGLEALGEIRPEPRMRLELEGVGGLMKGDPRPEGTQWDVERRGGLADVLLDEQEPARRRLGREQRQIVLAENLRAHESQQEAELARRDPAVGEGHRRLREAATARHHLVEQLLLQGADERREC